MVGLIDADLVLVGILGDSGAYFTDQPLLKQVPAVAEGRAVVTEGDEAHDFTRGYYSRRHLGQALGTGYF